MTSPLTQSEVFRAIEVIRARAYEFAEKVQPIFEVNRWTWAFSSGSRIPSVDDIFLHVLSLSHDLKPGAASSDWSSGRVSVAVHKYYDEHDITITISLVPMVIIDQAKTDKAKHERERIAS